MDELMRHGRINGAAHYYQNAPRASKLASRRKKRMEKVAAYCGTRNLYADMEMSAKSLVANSRVDRIHFFIEDPDFPSELPDIVQVHDASAQTFIKPDAPSNATQYTYMALLRAALFKLLPDDAAVLSLDCDTVAVADCTAIWDAPLDGCYFAAVPESWMDRRGTVYANAGVVLYNLAKLRDGKGDEVLQVLNSHYFRYCEQDAMNWLCQGRIAELGPEYNWCCVVNKGGKPGPRIIHYAARDDWRGEPEAVKYRDMTWDEAMARHADILA